MKCCLAGFEDPLIAAQLIKSGIGRNGAWGSVGSAFAGSGLEPAFKAEQFSTPALTAKIPNWCIWNGASRWDFCNEAKTIYLWIPHFDFLLDWQVTRRSMHSENHSKLCRQSEEQLLFQRVLEEFLPWFGTRDTVVPSTQNGGTVPAKRHGLIGWYQDCLWGMDIGCSLLDTELYYRQKWPGLQEVNLAAKW